MGFASDGRPRVHRLIRIGGESRKRFKTVRCDRRLRHIRVAHSDADMVPASCGKWEHKRWYQGTTPIYVDQAFTLAGAAADAAKARPSF
jgi:hypothetical protein